MHIDSTHNVITAIDNIDKLHMYLLRYNRHAQTDRVAIFKNPLQDQPTFQFPLPKPCGQYLLSP